MSVQGVNLPEHVINHYLANVYKCVRPAHTFINKMLALFRANYRAKKIVLTSEFHKDLEVVLGFSTTV